MYRLKRERIANIFYSINGMKILVQNASKRDDVIGNTNKQDPDFPRIISVWMPTEEPEILYLRSDQKHKNLGKQYATRICEYSPTA